MTYNRDKLYPEKYFCKLQEMLKIFNVNDLLLELYTRCPKSIVFCKYINGKAFFMLTLNMEVIRFSKVNFVKWMFFIAYFNSP